MLIFGFAVHIWRSYCGPIDKRNPPSTGPSSAAVLGVFLFEKLGEEHRRFGTAKVAIFVESKRTVNRALYLLLLITDGGSPGSRRQGL
jgi:hypothetical protein